MPQRLEMVEFGVAGLQDVRTLRPGSFPSLTEKPYEPCGGG